MVVLIFNPCVFSAACNGRRDCPDNSDERLCRQKSSMSNPSDPQCPGRDYFTCADHSRCLHKENLCNNVKDCPDGSDEVQYMCSAIG